MNSHWTRTTTDGMGRAVKVESGSGSTIDSIRETQYEPCACSPIGKVKRVSLPYRPGETVKWTEYVYDGLGPDGAGDPAFR